MPIISQFDYLKTIYKMEKMGVPATIGALAKHFNVAQPSVTQMIRTLTNKKFVSWKPRGPIAIESKGKEEAIKMIRRHRIIETFLVEVAKLDLWQAHVEAEQLEHSASDMLVDRMFQICNSPIYDPHGDPIPSHKGIFPDNISTSPLEILKEGEEAIIATVSDLSPKAIQELSAKGVKRGARIKRFLHRAFIIDKKKIDLSVGAIKSVGILNE